MKVVRESAEHHFLTTLEKIKQNPQGWIGLHFALSKKISHSQIIEQKEKIEDTIQKAREEAEALFSELAEKTSAIEKAYLYLFSDNDIVLLAFAGAGQDKNFIQHIYKDMAEKIGTELADTGVLVSEARIYQKLADQKLLSSKRFESYHAMCDLNKISSIGVRRTRREDPVVLLVEDDRFTASYTASILNKDYDLVVCRNGEDSISAYIEEAPDIVLLDIHLPGLSGHQTLAAIKAIDPEAFVVMLSVDTVKESIQKASKIGAKSFLKKPFSKERLINTVKTSPFIKGAISTESLH